MGGSFTVNHADPDLLWQLCRFESRGDFPNISMKIVDPDDVRSYTIYDDIEIEEGERERQCLVSLYPEYQIELDSGGTPEDCQAVISHAAALRDIRRELNRGWVLAEIMRGRL